MMSGIEKRSLARAASPVSPGVGREQKRRRVEDEEEGGRSGRRCDFCGTGMEEMRMDVCDACRNPKALYLLIYQGKLCGIHKSIPRAFMSLWESSSVSVSMDTRRLLEEQACSDLTRGKESVIDLRHDCTENAATIWKLHYTEEGDCWR